MHACSQRAYACSKPLAVAAPQPTLALHLKRVSPLVLAPILAGDVFSIITLDAEAQPLPEGLVLVAFDVGGLLGGHSGEPLLERQAGLAGGWAAPQLAWGASWAARLWLRTRLSLTSGLPLPPPAYLFQAIRSTWAAPTRSSS